ncbi:MAG: hypothetical protein LIO79_00830 [Rikenellaceae bacterium]|nr:hypothetical protein [Rikenellaceae bacterium]
MKYSGFRFVFIVVVCGLLGLSVLAQNDSIPVRNENTPVIRARVVPDTIMIGDRITLSLEIEKDIVQIVEFPFFNDEEMDRSFGYINETPVDTVQLGDRKVLLRKNYTLAVFDEGRYSLGNLPVLYIDKNITDTLYTTDSLHVYVDTYLIDLDNPDLDINDIKPPKKTSLLFSEISGYIFVGFAALQILIGLLYILIKTLRKKDDKPQIPLKPAIPAHIVAIQELERLNEQKLWQNNRHKMYYTRLTDIIREYIENRYGINAMEMTSDEIAEALNGIDLNERSFNQLRRLLSTADYVKFAKYIPSVEDNEMSYNDAYYFVEDTKEIPVKKEKNEED